jgi:hypothetical protein
MERERIVSLSYDKAIEAIKDAEKVLFRRGVWNPWEEVSADDAVKGIKDSSYGSDVYWQDERLYVSCPVGSDMW